LEELLAEGPADWDLVRVDEATVRRQPTLTAQWSLVDDVPEAPRIMTIPECMSTAEWRC
jgi:hypothetical protein